MSAIWKILSEALDEAHDSEKEKILKHVLDVYGKDAHDAVGRELQKHWSPEGLALLKKKFSSVGDADLNKILDRAAKAIKDRQDAADDRGSIDPEDFAAQQARTQATHDSRPDRAGTKPMDMPKTGKDYVPGERPQHDVGQSVRGSAPQHTRPVQHQTSQTGGIGSIYGSGTMTVGQRIDQLQSQLTKDPKYNDMVDIKSRLDKLEKMDQEEIMDDGETVGAKVSRLRARLAKPKYARLDKLQRTIDRLGEMDPEDDLDSTKPVQTSTGTDITDLQSKIDQMKQRLNVLQGGLTGDHAGEIKKTAQRANQLRLTAVKLRQSDPEQSREFEAQSQQLAQKVNQMRAELNDLPKKIKGMEQKLAGMAQTGKSGLADFQRQVDTMTKNGYEKLANQLAKKLGVPPSSARQVDHEVEDPKTGEKKTKTKYAIWSAEKISKWQRDGGQHLPGPQQPGSITYDPVPVKGGTMRPKPGTPEDEPAPWQTGVKAPDSPELGDVDSRGLGGLQPPRGKAPRGLTPDETAQYFEMRRKVAALKKSGAGEDEIELAKEPIRAILAKGGEMVDTIIPGRFEGDTWDPAKMSKTVKSSHPDRATGQMAYGSREVGPTSKSGNDPVLVWRNGKWSTEKRSQTITRNAERNVDLAQEPGARRPWMSQAQTVQGNVVPNDANTQKVQAKAEPAPDKSKPSLFQKHRDIKGVVGQAFDTSKEKPKTKTDEPESSEAE